MTNPYENYVAKVSDDDLGQVAELANTQLEIEREIAEAEENLKELKRKHADIALRDLPELMESLGLETFKTTSGAKVSIKENLYASIAKDRKPKAAEWLIDHGQDALVKRDVHLPFKAGDVEAVHELTKILEQFGYANYSVDFDMHTGAVKSALKELIAEGTDVPFDLFGLRRVIEAKISL